jgi:hypothetical protein
MSAYKFASYSRLLDKEGGEEEELDTYAWCVFVDATARELASIRQVEYTLHSSFPKPVRVIRDGAHCFPVMTQGWGEFTLRIRITTTDGGITRQSYGLKLEEASWPLGPRLRKFDSEVAKNIYDNLLSEDWDWRSLSTLAKNAGVGTIQVKSILGEWGQRGLAREAPFLSINGEELWGATCKIGILPAPRE